MISSSTRAYTDMEAVKSNLDHIWLIICGAMVMFMQAGFALVESGCCRAKNVQNILLKNLTDVCIGTIGWWISGWAIAYGGPMNADGFLDNGFMGTEQWFGMGFVTYAGDGKFEPTTGMLNWFFQWASRLPQQCLPLLKHGELRYLYHRFQGTNIAACIMCPKNPILIIKVPILLPPCRSLIELTKEPYSNY